uniref:AlNc14C123G6722 protein n=1 Tax=Albugo laibachii Nc14 TaxID=890382 RepID=F0WJJ7_9STRA|nr:AlNc14C123G6722 [Albugo laibachii Nc14]|eukprot:CCA21446.1 AlNc14C123G6722 [Albugo laibachii Nc14]
MDRPLFLELIIANIYSRHQLAPLRKLPCLLDEEDENIHPSMIAYITSSSQNAF